MRLRDYQQAAVNSTLEKWKETNSLLGCAPTGSGKTVMFCDIIRQMLPLRALVLAHTTELVAQTVEKLSRFGIDAEIEQGQLHASTSLWNHAPVVVATPQTLYHGGFKRLQLWKPQDFGVVIVDECHKYAGAACFEKVVKHFKQNTEAKIIGITATADRFDNVSLARVFDDVAFDIDICDLIEQGYLVGVDQRMVKIRSLDFSKCRTTAGDLNGRDLADVLDRKSVV
jgi:superfamily II DNA or RNA helicase